MQRAATLLAILAFLAAPLAPARAEGKVLILDYHTFLGTKTSSLDYSEQELAAVLDQISAMGYKFVTLEDAIAGRVTGSANVVVTIDDGNHSIYPAFKNVFEPRGIKPFLFIYPAIVLGRQRYALGPDQIVALMDAGCGVGAHGYHHNPVSDKAWARDQKDFLSEIRKPGPALAKITGKSPTAFAYPFGVSSRKAEEELAAAGYAWAFAADASLVQVDFSDPSLDRMAVPRTIAYRYNRAAMLKSMKALLEGGPSR